MAEPHPPHPFLAGASPAAGFFAFTISIVVRGVAAFSVNYECEHERTVRGGRVKLEIILRSGSSK